LLLITVLLKNLSQSNVTLIITDNKRLGMKFYKIINSKSGHHGLFYKEGRNVDPLPFNPHGNCEKGGIYFSREDIFYFWNYGDEVYEVIPISEIYENPWTPKKWKCKEIDLKHIGKTSELKTIKHLVEQGADIHADYDLVLFLASKNNNLDVVKYLIEQGANIHSLSEQSLRTASTNGHLDVVKYLVEHNADIHIDNEFPLRIAAYLGRLDVVKYLVGKGADIHACNDETLQWASDAGHKEIVKFLKSCE